MISPASAAPAVRLKAVFASAAARSAASMARPVRAVRWELMTLPRCGVLLVVFQPRYGPWDRAKKGLSRTLETARTDGGERYRADQGRRRSAPPGSACQARWAASRAKVIVTAESEASA